MLTSSRGYLPQDEDESDDDNDLTFTFDDDLWNDIPIENNNQSNEVPRLRPVRLPRIERGTERRITESDGLNSIDIERIINELGGSLDSIIRRPEDNQENNEINPF
jgi:hypothetical protein